MAELDEGERAFLTAFVAVHTPTEAEALASVARARARMAAASVGSGPGLVSTSTPIPIRSRRSRPWVMLGVATVTVAAAVALLWRLDVTTMLASERRGPDPSEAAYSGQEGGEAQGEAVARVPKRAPLRSKAGSGSVSDRMPEVIEEPEIVEEPEVIEEPEPPHRSTPRKPPAPKADATLHAEIALLRPAQQALRSGDDARALRLFDSHAKSFPRSVLGEERSLGRIVALCGLGRTSQVEQSVRAFTREHPGSPLTGRVTRACPTPTPAPTPEAP